MKDNEILIKLVKIPIIKILLCISLILLSKNNLNSALILLLIFSVLYFNNNNIKESFESNEKQNDPNKYFLIYKSDAKKLSKLNNELNNIYKKYKYKKDIFNKQNKDDKYPGSLIFPKEILSEINDIISTIDNEFSLEKESERQKKEKIKENKEKKKKMEELLKLKKLQNKLEEFKNKTDNYIYILKSNAQKILHSSKTLLKSYYDYKNEEKEFNKKNPNTEYTKPLIVPEKNYISFNNIINILNNKIKAEEKIEKSLKISKNIDNKSDEEINKNLENAQLKLQNAMLMKSIKDSKKI